MEERKVKFGIGVYLWVILCMIAALFSTVASFTANLNILAVFGIINFVLFTWLLIEKKRLAFYLLVLSTILVFSLNVSLFQVRLFAALPAFLNPVITYAVLSKYWYEMD